MFIHSLILSSSGLLILLNIEVSYLFSSIASKEIMIEISNTQYLFTVTLGVILGKPFLRLFQNYSYNFNS
jgi:hypothetical protein